MHVLSSMLSKYFLLLLSFLVVGSLVVFTQSTKNEIIISGVAPFTTLLINTTSPSLLTTPSPSPLHFVPMQQLPTSTPQILDEQIYVDNENINTNTEQDTPAETRDQNEGQLQKEGEEGREKEKQESTPSPLDDLPKYSTMLQLALAQECATTNWVPHLYLNCDPIVMGAYNAINKLQVCIRWAIDAGASLIRPKFMTRGKELTDIRGDFPRVSIEYLLDERYLWESLTLNCPKMKVIELESIQDKATIIQGVQVEYFIERFWKGEFAAKLQAIIANSSAQITPESPLVVTEVETLGAWIRSYDPLEFQIAYRNIFRLSRVYVPPAEKILSKLPYSFFGVHLRLEKDWTANGDDVMGVFLGKILEHNTTTHPIAYVASGDEEKLAQFTTLAAEKGVQVVHKWNMLDEEEIGFLKGLEFDQMGMVDRLVLEKSEYFYGVGGSSFSYSLGQHRHYEQTGDMEYYPRNDERQYLEGWEGDMWYGLLW